MVVVLIRVDVEVIFWGKGGQSAHFLSIIPGRTMMRSEAIPAGTEKSF